MTRALRNHPRGVPAPSPEPDRTQVGPGDTPTGQAVSVRPGTPAARGLGVSDRTDDGAMTNPTGAPGKGGSPIPGGRPHLANPPSVRHQVVSPAPAGEFRGMMAHGVPAENTPAHERAEAMRGPNGVRRTADHQVPVPREQYPPVPVYLVAGQGRDAPRRLATANRYFVRPLGQEPTKLCGIDPGRYRIGLLNEDTAINMRFADSIGALSAPGTGATMAAVLPAVTNSYLWIHTQGELWINADGTAGAYVSVINEFDQ